MSEVYTCSLYMNASNPHVFNKTLAFKADVECRFKTPVDVENPEIYIAASDDYDRCNYMYIPEFGRYYFCKGVVGPSTTITFTCESDPLMSFKNAILASPAVISRNPWEFDLYVSDPNLPIESRTVKSVIPFPQTELFKGNNNCYILTTIGPGGNIIPDGGDE